jgi:hypothetical protein
MAFSMVGYTISGPKIVFMLAETDPSPPGVLIGEQSSRALSPLCLKLPLRRTALIVGFSRVIVGVDECGFTFCSGIDKA